MKDKKVKGTIKIQGELHSIEISKERAEKIKKLQAMILQDRKK